MKKQGIILRTKEELKETEGRAWSIGAYNIPEEPIKYLGSLAENNNIYHYYKDRGGNYYFETERGLKFDREMREAQKRHREKKRRD